MKDTKMTATIEEIAREIIRIWDKNHVAKINAAIPCMPYGSLEKLIVEALRQASHLPSENEFAE